jgi:hypothetical protein
LSTTVEMGNPPVDASMLEAAIKGMKARTGRAPRAVTADRDYGEVGIEQSLRAPASATSCCQQRAYRTPGRAIEKRRAFKTMVHWRGTDQLCETRLQPGANTPRRDRGKEDVVWTWDLRPQPLEDQWTSAVTPSERVVPCPQVRTTTPAVL